MQNSTTMDIHVSEGLFICLVFINKIPVLRKPTFTFQIKASCFLSSSPVYSHLFTHNILIYKNRKEKKKGKNKGKLAYRYTRHKFEKVRSDQRSRAFELVTATVQLLVRGGYLQNIHKVITI